MELFLKFQFSNELFSDFVTEYIILDNSVIFRLCFHLLKYGIVFEIPVF